MTFRDRIRGLIVLRGQDTNFNQLLTAAQPTFLSSRQLGRQDLDKDNEVVWGSIGEEQLAAGRLKAERQLPLPHKLAVYF